MSSPLPSKAGYAKPILELLGDRNPLTVMAATADALAASIVGIDDAVLQKAEAPEKWSIADVIQHLADAEWVLGFRYRQIAAEDNVTLPFFDENAWARELKYQPINVERAMEDFRALREINLRFLRRIPEEKYSRAGFHPERGPESIEHCMKLYAGHDLVHLRQIGRIKTAVTAAS